jgi:hypothetical protein
MICPKHRQEDCFFSGFSPSRRAREGGSGGGGGNGGIDGRGQASRCDPPAWLLPFLFPSPPPYQRPSGAPCSATIPRPFLTTHFVLAFSSFLRRRHHHLPPRAQPGDGARNDAARRTPSMFEEDGPGVRSRCVPCQPSPTAAFPHPLKKCVTIRAALRPPPATAGDRRPRQLWGARKPLNPCSEGTLRSSASRFRSRLVAYCQCAGVARCG